MIALLAAVPQETRQISKAIENGTTVPAHGLDVTLGTIAGIKVCLTHSGIGKAAAAAAATALLCQFRPEALWLFGCGGAYPNSGLGVGDLALADSEIFGDEGVAAPGGFDDLAAMGLAMRRTEEARFNLWPTDKALRDWAMQQGEKMLEGPFVTLSTCTGTTANALEIEARTGGICENMEGAAVALACHQLSIPILEIRGISNMVEDRDTSRWDLPAATAAAQQAIRSLLKAWSMR